MTYRTSRIAAIVCLILAAVLLLVPNRGQDGAGALPSRLGILFGIVGGVLFRRGTASPAEQPSMDWYEASEKYHAQTLAEDARLSSLPENWQRELAALWRLEAEVNNGGYLQFVSNWGRESYHYASQALHKIGAKKMANIVDQCQTLIDEHFDFENRPIEELREMLPNEIIDSSGTVLKEAGSILPDEVLQRIMELSYDFMDYPDDLAKLGVAHYRDRIEADA